MGTWPATATATSPLEHYRRGSQFCVVIAPTMIEMACMTAYQQPERVVASIRLNTCMQALSSPHPELGAYLDMTYMLKSFVGAQVVYKLLVRSRWTDRRERN